VDVERARSAGRDPHQITLPHGREEALMHSALRQMLAETRQEELMRVAERERRAARATRPPAHEDVLLGDGRGVRIRPLRAEDRAKYARAVAGLSPRSRYLRFAAPLPRISQGLLDQMMDFDGARHVVYGALTTDESAIVGVVRYVERPGDRCAEVAIAVADEWQGRGVGQKLLGRLVEHARQAELDCLLATILSENAGSLRLAGEAGFSFVRRSGASAEYEMCLGGA
jgi:RimJ/RimL family protein N-acetyltransferase